MGKQFEPNFMLFLQDLETLYIGEAKFKTMKSRSRNGVDGELVIPDTLAIKIQDKSLITPTARRFFDIIALQLKRNCNKGNTVYITISEYMNLLGLVDVKHTRKQALRDMQALHKIQFHFLEKSKSKLIGKGFVSISGGYYRIINDVIFFDVSEPFYRIMKRFKIMNLNINAFKIDVNKFPNAYYLSKYLDFNYNLNHSKDRLSSISIVTLLKHCPELPPIENIGRKTRERIMRPFFRDINAVGIPYKIAGRDGKEIKNPEEMSVSDFLTAKLVFDYTRHIELIGNPRETKLEALEDDTE